MPYKNQKDQRNAERRYQLKDPERKRAQVRKCYKELKLQLLTHYGNGKCTCVVCGFDDIRALCIDHINNDGASHRKEINSKGGYRTYYWLKRHGLPSGYQTLCANCNSIKRAEHLANSIKEPNQPHPTLAHH